MTVSPAVAAITVPEVERRRARSWWPNRPGPYLAFSLVLAGIAYATGMPTGFASDDYGWLRHGVRGELGWDTAGRVAGHTNALPLEISLYHLKFMLFGFNPLGYHLFALAGHMVNVLLVYVLAHRLGASVRVASLAAGLAAVLAAGSQAVYWMSGDPHVFATMLSIGALVLYIDHRERGGWWRFAGALILALIAPLVKAEGVSVVVGVAAYEFICQQRPTFTWRVLPFAAAPIPFVLWEWTTTDQLSSRRGFGLNVVTSGFDYLRQLSLPLDPAAFIESGGGLLHRLLYGTIGVALVLEGAVLTLLFLVGLSRRQNWMLLFFGLGGTAPALTVTLGAQSRYVYLAALVSAPIIASGSNRLFRFAWMRYPRGALIPITTLVLAIIISLQTWIAAFESGALRAAHGESLAFRNAVLSDHATVPDGTQICLINSPLDPGTAIAVFADPRLNPGVGIPVVYTCGTVAAAPPEMWVYIREPNGTYVSAR